MNVSNFLENYNILQEYFEFKTETFVAGNLKNHYNDWCQITDDVETLETVQGLKIEFEKEIPKSVALHQNKFCIKQKSFLKTEIDRLIKKKVITLAKHEIYSLSSCFARVMTFLLIV